MTISTITLYRSPDSNVWLARHSSPTVLDLFGTDTLPTAWHRDCPPATVLASIQTLNPNAAVSTWPPSERRAVD